MPPYFAWSNQSRCFSRISRLGNHMREGNKILPDLSCDDVGHVFSWLFIFGVPLCQFLMGCFLLALLLSKTARMVRFRMRTTRDIISTTIDSNNNVPKQVSRAKSGFPITKSPHVCRWGWRVINMTSSGTPIIISLVFLFFHDGSLNVTLAKNRLRK